MKKVKPDLQNNKCDFVEPGETTVSHVIKKEILMIFENQPNAKKCYIF